MRNLSWKDLAFYWASALLVVFGPTIALADVVGYSTSNSSSTAATTISVSTVLPGDATSLEVCTFKNTTANASSITNANGGSTSGFISSNTNGIYIDSVESYGQTLTTDTWTATYPVSVSASSYCDVYDQAGGPVYGVGNQSATAATAVASGVNVTGVGDWVGGAAFRKTAGTSLSAGSNTAFRGSTLFSQGLVTYVPSTTTSSGTYTLNVNASVSDTLALISYAVPSYVAPVPVDYATSSVDQSHSDLMFLWFVFFSSMAFVVYTFKRK